MNRMLLGICACACSWTALAMDIGSGIRTGDRVRLEKATPSDDTEAARIITESFQAAMAARGAGIAVTLHITHDGLGGESALGNVVLVDDSLAALPEDERVFEIAHELGHIDLGHFERMIALFQQYVGDSTDDHYIARTLNVHADDLSPALQALEYEADAYGQALVSKVPGALDGGIHTFQRNVFRRGDFSHPSPRERMLKLEAALAEPARLAAAR